MPTLVLRALAFCLLALSVALLTGCGADRPAGLTTEQAAFYEQASRGPLSDAICV